MIRRAARESTVGTMLASARDRLRSIVAGSWLARLVDPLRSRLPDSGAAPQSDQPDPSETSRLGAIRANSSVLRTIRQSRLARGVGGVRATLGAARRTSGLSRLSRAGGRYVEASWLYRWLTAEPEPDVIVIDLRETLTVGPWLKALERGTRWLLPAAASSALIGFGRRCHRLATSRPVQLASLFVGGVAAALLLVTAVSGTASVIFVAVLTLVALLAIIGSRVDWTWADLKQTRGFQALAAAFEPPEPPEPAGESLSENEPEPASGDGSESETAAESDEKEQAAKDTE